MGDKWLIYDRKHPRGQLAPKPHTPQQNILVGM